MELCLLFKAPLRMREEWVIGWTHRRNRKSWGNHVHHTICCKIQMILSCRGDYRPIQWQEWRFQLLYVPGKKQVLSLQRSHLGWFCLSFSFSKCKVQILIYSLETLHEIMKLENTPILVQREVHTESLLQTSATFGRVGHWLNSSHPWENNVHHTIYFRGRRLSEVTTGQEWRFQLWGGMSEFEFLQCKV